MSTPPSDWVGQQASDGYEYLEYPFGSGNFWYRLIGSQQWLLQNLQVPQANISPETYQGSYSGFSGTPVLGNQFTTNQQVHTDNQYGQNIQGLSQTAYMPSASLNKVLNPPKHHNHNYNDNFQPMITSFNAGENKDKRLGKKIIIAIFVPFILIALSGVLYVWASSLAGESSSSSFSDGCEDNDSDCDGVADVYDNCMYISNYNQENFDGDSYGDACDDDIDGDGVLNTNDFHDYGNGKLIFKWEYARIDDGESYDGDESGPDVYAELEIDYDKDGTTDETKYTGTTNNIREWTNLGEIEIDPRDSRSSIKIGVILWDDDYGADDPLDYVSGTGGNYKIYTIYLSESTYTIKEGDGRDDDKGLKARFVFDSTAS